VLVQTGNNILDQMGAREKQTKTSQSDQKDFQKALDQAQTKKKAPLAKKKTATSTSKKALTNDAYDENVQTARHDSKVNKEESESSKKAQPSSSDMLQLVDQNKVKHPKVSLEDFKAAQKDLSQDSLDVKADTSKFLSQENIETQLPDSLNLSTSPNKTLEENQKNLLESSLQKNLTQSPVNIENNLKAMNQEDNSMGVIPMATPKIVQNKSQLLSKFQNNGLQKVASTDGKIKLDPEMKLAESMETLATNKSGSSKVIKSLSNTSQQTGMENATQDLDSLMTSFLEQDNGSTVQESNNFTEALGLAQSTEQSPEIENMQSIIQKARAVIDEGGGEMEIHLQPEGLGKVHLKVAVQDGRVNVEMMADNNMAKKALEEGILNMKNSLEAQKLIVDTFKVDMSPDYQKDFSDLQNHMQEQANRDFAQDFLGQFRQEREAKLGGLFDSFRNFQPHKPEQELALSRNRYQEAGKGRSINLVA
jgi:flagellar hook-length control protein FliK